MSKPYGYYLDPALDRLGRSGPVGDWLTCTAIFAVLAGTIGWVISLPLIVWLFVPDFDGNRNFGWLYLGAVLAWVVPVSAWLGYRTWRDWTHRGGPWSPEAMERRGVGVSRG